MKDFFRTRIGHAVMTALTTMTIWAICTPIFEILFRGGIKEFDSFKYIIEPILVGTFVGIFEYIFQFSNKRKDEKQNQTKKKSNP